MNTIVNKFNSLNKIQQKILSTIIIALSVFWVGITVAIPLDKLEYVVIITSDGDPIIFPGKNKYGFEEQLTDLELRDLELCNASTSCQPEALSLGAEYFNEIEVDGFGLVVAYYNGKGKLIATKQGGRLEILREKYVPQAQARLGIITESDINNKTKFPSSDSNASNNKPVGYIEGDFAVNAMGAATYNIPIAIPPGSAGVRPEISLAYSSQSGDGPLGQGWSISGLSAISRCPKTLAQDGEISGVNMDANDRFCLDGQRLIETGQTVGTGNNSGDTVKLYRAEIDNYDQIRSYDQNRDGQPEFFYVRTKAGEIKEYGKSNTGNENARLILGDKTLTWGINRLRDLKQNYIDYEYLIAGQNSIGGYFLPKKISYTGNLATGLTPYAHILFNYGSKKPSHQVVEKYFKGKTFFSSHRLDSIEIKLDEFTLPIRKYKLTYFKDDEDALLVFKFINDQSRLWNIEECATNSEGEESCLPKTWFKWDGAYDSNQVVSANSAVATAVIGAPDLPTYTPDEIEFKPSFSGHPKFTDLPQPLNKFGWDHGYSSRYGYRLVGDVNGDGLSDVVGVNFIDISPDIEGILAEGVNVTTSEEIVEEYEDILPPNKELMLNNSNKSKNKTTKSKIQLSESTVKKEAVVVQDTIDTTSARILGGNDTRIQVVVALGAGSVSGSGFKTSGFNASAATHEALLDISTRIVAFPRFLADVNGDGLSDLVSINRDEVLVALSTGTEFSSNVPWLGGGNFTYSQGWIRGVNPRFLQDINGDGKADLVGSGVINGLDGVHVSLSTGSGFETPVRWTEYFGRKRVKEYYPTWDFSKPYVDLQLVDISGDGLLDIVGFSETFVSVAINTSVVVNGVKTNRFKLRETNGLFGMDIHYPNNYKATESTPMTTGDVNGDGQADLVAFFNDGFYIAYSTGTSFKPFELKRRYFGYNDNAGKWRSHHKRYVVDVNGDGRADIVGIGNSDIVVSLSMGSLRGSIIYGKNDFSFPTFWLDGLDNTWNSPHDIRTFGDIDGDGLLDIISFGKNGVFSALNGAEPRRITQILEGGYFPENENPDNNALKFSGLNRGIDISYDKLTSKSVYTPKPSGMTGESITPAMFVVSNHKSFFGDDLDGGYYYGSYLFYYYGGLKIDKRGRGLKGFYYRRVFDIAKRTYTESFYRQHFPYIGMLYESKTIGPDGTQLRTWNSYGLPDNWNKKYYPVYLKDSLNTTFPLTSATNGAYKRESITNEEIDSCGNVGRVINKTQNRATHKLFTKITNSHYKPSAGSCFHKSRLDYATVKSTATGETSLPDRKSSFTYTSKGQIETETIHDMDGKGLDLSLTTTYQYDAYGNVIKKSLAGSGLSNRYTLTEYDHHSTALKRGRFATKTTNALGQFSTKKYDTRFGTVTSIIGLNGLEIRKRYNAFGQKYLEIPPNNNWILTQYHWLNGEKNQSFTRYRVHSESSNKMFTRTFYDHLDRPIRTVQKNIVGKLVYTEKVYKNAKNGVIVVAGAGLLEKESLPFFSKEQANAPWVRYKYDRYDRPIGITQPDNSLAKIKYNGLTTTTTDANNNQKIEKRRADGKLDVVTDANGNTIRYYYYADGNLKETRVSATTANGQIRPETGTIISKFEYDGIGNKVYMKDPDMGEWHYEYNAVGELIKQTNANNDVVRMTYDNLGRLVWRWGGNEASKREYDVLENDSGTIINTGKSAGKLVKIKNNNSSKTFTYTDLGQIKKVTERLPVLKTGDITEYTTTSTYDEYGRLDVLSYPSDDPDYPLALKYEYEDFFNSGTLNKISNAQTGVIYWELLDTNAAGKITRQKFGDNITATRSYDKLNRVKSISSGTAQALSYQYDAVSNLTQRKDNLFSAEENFRYDALNRLIRTETKTQGARIPQAPAVVNTSTIIAHGDPRPSYNTNTLIKTIKYDGHGNIKQKDGKTYVYGDGLHKHAVSKVGTINYTYDANGNMINGGGRTQTWKSFDKPATITKTSGNKKKISLTYDADHNRIRKRTIDVATDRTKNTTLYIGGGLVERKRIISGTNTGAEVYKFYLKVGGQNIGTITQNISKKGTRYLAKTRYLLTDHLGSIDVIIDNGAVSKQSFSAWGKRRNKDWNVASTSELDNLIATLNKKSISLGFTGHEHDDEVGLINMKGRLYDAEIGRFISADPFIQAPALTQSYNRYSYVLNNPLSYTDPSGYFFNRLLKNIRGFFDRYARTIVALFLQTGFTLVGGPFVGGYVGGYVSTGSGKAAQRSGWLSVLSAGLARGVKWAYKVDGLGRQIAHGITQGGVNVLRGGKFGAGFVSAFVSHRFAPNMNDHDIFIRTARQAMIGGTVSAIVGGKFANGAVTAAFVHMFNAEAGRKWTQLASKEKRQIIDDVVSKAKALKTRYMSMTNREIASENGFGNIPDEHLSAHILSVKSSINGIIGRNLAGSFATNGINAIEMAGDVVSIAPQTGWLSRLGGLISGGLSGPPSLYRVEGILKYNSSNYRYSATWMETKIE